MGNTYMCRDVFKEFENGKYLHGVGKCTFFGIPKVFSTTGFWTFIFVHFQILKLLLGFLIYIAF